MFRAVALITMDIQTERAYLKQEAVFENRKATLGKRKGTALRYVRNVGLGFKTPSEVGRSSVSFHPSYSRSIR